ncbi:MAG: hypothetical protein ACXWCG_08715 [Flavitalea sp.]
MSIRLDKVLSENGTRFLIFPQSRILPSFTQPESVKLSITPAQIKEGPQDHQLYVVDAVQKLPYSGRFRPPYSTEKNQFTQAGKDGHFDHLKPDTREFGCASMYAIVRRVLDIWEDYIGKNLVWHFESDFDRLELIPFVNAANSFAGYGYIELGFAPTSAGAIDPSEPYCLNFDVIAHEVGHIIIFSLLGEPAPSSHSQNDFRGMHESFSDVIAIICSLHFHSVVDHLLNHTKGNLFSRNELSRVGELSGSREVRLAFNDSKFDDRVTASHSRSLPLTGAIFDVFVEVFQKKLVNAGLISQALAEASSFDAHISQNVQEINERFSAAYAGKQEEFKAKLLEARDYLGNLLGKAWSTLNVDDITYHKILRSLIKADRELNAENIQTIRECFAWRKISLSQDSLFLTALSLEGCSSEKEKAKERFHRKKRKR